MDPVLNFSAPQGFLRLLVVTIARLMPTLLGWLGEPHKVNNKGLDGNEQVSPSVVAM